MAKKKVVKQVFDKSMMGQRGVIGGRDLQVNYIQLNLPVTEIDILGLVSEIPGSEQWPVRQLFQRDIDVELVTKEIIPYFQSGDKVKFFNPLTIAVMPIDSLGGLKGKLREEKEAPHDDYEKAFSIKGLYKVSFDEAEGNQALIEWNTSKVKLVAIDGQHRLSSLKRMLDLYKSDPSNADLTNIDFLNWTVPVVLVTVGHASSEGTTESILEKTRSIFVTINKQAKPPTRSRTILLNDYSVSAICCQELLDSAREEKVSLGFFNWRDAHDDEMSLGGPSLLGVDELEDIVINYLVGEDQESFNLTSDQKDRMFWDDIAPSPSANLASSDLRELVRSRFSETVEPAFFYILKNCQPYSSYVEFLSKMESNGSNDIHKHAWSRIVYGTDFSSPPIDKEIEKRRIEILEDCKKRKEDLGNVFSRAIGLRAIYSGLEHFAEHYWNNVEIVSWEQVSQFYVSAFNQVYSSGVLKGDDFLNNVALDRGAITNYKPQQVKKGLGALLGYCSLKVCSDTKDADISELRDSIYRTIVNGVKKNVRPHIKQDMVGRAAEEINAAVTKKAESEAESQVKRIDNKMKKIK